MATRVGQQIARGGIILCGGASRRMGQPKAWLPLGDETILQRIVRTVMDAVGPTVVVSAAGQNLPPLPTVVPRLEDALPDRGPLEGLRAGLSYFANQAEAVYVTSCDVPLLRSSFVTRLFELLESYDAVIPVDGGRRHVLTAVYRPRVLPIVERLLAADRRRVMGLCELVNARFVCGDELRPYDPDLRSLINVNEPADYERALALATRDS